MPELDPQRQFAVEVVRRLKEAGHRALWAGGCVRDFLMGRAPKDYDVATDALPQQVREVFGRRKTLAVGESFGVVIIVGPKEAGNVEVATFRTDLEYIDGRRPTGIVFSTPEEDARRRDFTINGMFYDPVEARVLDFVGGERDLAAGLIRAIGDPHDRMREDKLRMLRAVRFTATMDFRLDPATADAVREMAGEITVVSAERIAQELRRMLVDPRRARAMDLARDLGLLAVTLPELRPLLDDSDEWTITHQMLHLLQAPSFELAAAALWHPLPPEQAADLGKRLRLSNDEIARITWLLAHRRDLRDAPRLSLASLKRTLAHEWAADLIALNRVEALARNADLSPVTYCEEFLRQTPPEEINPPPLLDGSDLKRLGLTPGPQFKMILDAARDAQLNGVIRTKEEAIEFVRRLLREWGVGKN